MGQAIEERVERLLSQLEDPRLTEAEIERLQKKIDYLNSLKG